MSRVCWLTNHSNISVVLYEFHFIMHNFFLMWSLQNMDMLHVQNYLCHLSLYWAEG